MTLRENRSVRPCSLQSSGPYARYRTLRKLVSLDALIVASAASPAIADSPMTVMRSASAKADSVLHLNWGLLTICVLVIGITGVLLVLALARQPASRPSLQSGLPLPVSRPPGGVTWIYVGIGLTALTLLGSLIWSMVVLAHVAAPPGRPGLTIDVTAHQWWWQVRYDGDPPSRQFTTANEIHIPIGVPVRVRLK